MWAGAEGGPPARKAMEASLRGRIGPALWERFQQATVAVCGLGGLGSHIALALARAGVGTLRLFDFDRVDLTNLHRQQYKASQIGQPKALALAESPAYRAVSRPGDFPYPSIRMVSCFGSTFCSAFGIVRCRIPSSILALMSSGRTSSPT